jgi:hypothetical protein
VADEMGDEETTLGLALELGTLRGHEAVAGEDG